MTTYYCDYKNGNDSTGDGSSGSPWKTISHSVGQMSSSDTLNVRGSDAEDECYFDDVRNTGPPASSTIQNDTGHAPVISQSTKKAAGDFSKTGGQTNVYECSHTGSLYGDAPVWHDFSSPTRLTEASDVADCDSTENSYYFDDANNKVYVHVTGGAAPGSVLVNDDVASSFKPTASGITIDGLTWKFGDQGVVTDTGSDSLTIQNCSAYYASHRLVDAAFRVKNGSVTMSNLTGGDAYSGSFIHVESSATDATISDITVTDYAGRPIWIEACSTSLSISDVTFTRCGAANAPFEIKEPSGFSLTRFTLVDPIDNAVTVYVGGTVSYGVIYYTGDETYSVHDHGIVMHNDSGTVEVYHITVHNAQATTGDSGFGDAYYIAGDGTMKLRNCGAVDCGYGVYVSTGYSETLDLDYLGLYNNTTDYQNVDAADEASNEVTTDPAFTDEANHDYTLTSGSPWIDAGTTIASVNDDYEGSAPDIGRYEYESAAVNDIWNHPFVHSTLFGGPFG